MIFSEFPSSWIEINKNALFNNIMLYKKIVGDGALAPIIKGNAYGHGMSTIALLLDNSDHVGYLSLFFLSEALYLRGIGIKKTILVLGCIDRNPAEAIGQDIIFLVGSHRLLSSLHEVGISHRSPFTIHLKIDTGLSRFGISPEEMSTTISFINTLSGIRLTGFASHCAESQSDNQKYTRQQREIFDKTCKNYILQNPELSYHMGNSALTGRYHDTAHNAIHRIGIGTYGYWSSDSTRHTVQTLFPWFHLQPVLSWKTKILEIKYAKKGSYIGYNRTYCAPKNICYGIIPVGYYDGYPPSLSHTGKVKIGTQYVPVIGRVAMNTIMIDLSEHSHTATLDDEVLLMGDDPELNAYQLATQNHFDNARYLLTSLRQDIFRIVT